MNTIRISVRNLVEFLMRSGDIDSSSSIGNALQAMQEGSRVHRQVQSEGGESYAAEVVLGDLFYFPKGKYQVTALRKACPQEEKEISDFALKVEGRADGIITKDDSITIEEIKGMYYDVKELTEPIPVHEAQAKCYAYLYLRKKGLKQNITVRMTYVSLDTDARQYFRHEYSFPDLEKWFFSLLKEYRKWAVWQIRHLDKRQKSLQDLTFPYPYRPGQRDTAAYVYRTIDLGRKLYLQAPTGSGKTLATVFPTLKAMGMEKADHLFYLTAKTVTRKSAEECFALLRKNGLFFSTVVLTAKTKICPLGADHADKCNSLSCSHAKGHFDRINDALYDGISHQEVFDRKRITALANKHQVCPFELSLDLSNFADGVICDYNYVFDPSAHLQRFVNGEGIRDTVLLIDEAHNLPDRARNMFSAVLTMDSFANIQKELLEVYGTESVRKEMRIVLDMLAERKESCGQQWQRAENLGMLYNALKMFQASVEEFFAQLHAEIPALHDLRQLYFDTRKFLDAYERSESHYINYEEGNENYAVTIACCDPSKDLKEVLKRVKSTIFFSATLLPMEYYRKLLCAEETDASVYARSVFDEWKQKILIAGDVTSLYQERGKAMYQRCAAYIGKMCRTKYGNYLVFFPSFPFLDAVAAYLRDLPEVEYIAQERGMSEADREDFLSCFSEPHEHSLCGLAVLGSVFSEGINLEKDKLVGVMIIGTGIPQISTEAKVLQTYFEEQEMDGFAYAYTYPGISKVLQAGGRLIRTEEDKGVLILADRRFAGQRYQSMFPKEWSNREFCTIETMEEKMCSFWDEESERV